MPANILDIAIVLAYAALNIDIVFQIRRIRYRHSSQDVSILGDVLRLLAVVVLWWRFVDIDDNWLVIGQGLLAINMLVYLSLLIWYRKRGRAGG